MPFLDLADARLHYREWGSGPLTVAAHGLGLDHRLFADLAEALPGRRVVALDLRGYGPSTGARGRALSMELLGDDIARAVRALGADSADLVGFSMGGFALLALLERAPETARTVALVDARANADSPEERAGRDRFVRLVLEEGPHAFASAFLPKLTAPDPDALLAARLRDLLEAVPCETLVANLQGLKQRPSRMDLLDDVEVPTLVAVGEHDALVATELAAEMAARLPAGTLAVLPGVGHTTPLEAPAVLAEVLEDFWGAAG